MISNLQCDIHITPLAFDVVGIEHFGIPTFQDAALATRLAIVQAFPSLLHIDQSLFSGGVIYFRWSHNAIKLYNRHLNHPVQFVFEDTVGFLDFAQREAVRDEGSGVDLADFNQTKHLLAVATIHTTGLEGEVLAIHIGQGKHLGLVVKGNHGYNSIGSGTLPSQAEGVISPSHFEHAVGSPVVAMLQYELLALFGRGEQHIGVMRLHEATSLFGLLTDDDALRLL